MSKVKTYNKLVRDKVIEAIESSGRIAHYHIGSDEEYKIKLKEKLYEEVEEFLEDPCLEEAADILEVVMNLCREEGVDTDCEKLSKTIEKKKNKAGGFLKKIILEKVEEK